jgi:hypothetical protein
MKLWVRTLVYKEIITGITINWCKELRILRTVEEELRLLKDSGHSLLIGSIFGRLEITDYHGNRDLYPFDDQHERWRDNSLQVIRALFDSGIEFEIIGNKEDQEFLQKVNPLLYNKLLPHIVWKGKKYGNRKSKGNT